MKRKFDEQLEALKNRVVAMGEVAKCMVQDAMKALVERDNRWIREVLQHEEKLDKFQVEIDNEAIRLMAVQSPVAQDLRLILTAVRINSELERVGDLCVNMCENVQLLIGEPPLKPLIDLPKMAETASHMLYDSLQAFLEGAPEKAVRVIEQDDQVDALNEQIFRELLTYMISDTKSITRSLSLLLMSRHLERIGDHATNIAEEVVYMVRGEDIRHQHPEGEKQKLIPNG